MAEIEGVIKYKVKKHIQVSEISEKEIKLLEQWRKKLYHKKLIGKDPKTGLGYGNLSRRTLGDNSNFLITASQTGHLAELSGMHYTYITHFNISKMEVQMKGPRLASSESITHAAIYDHNPKIQAVFHIHSFDIWKAMLNDNHDFTPENIPYGTQEMARSVQKCIGKNRNGCFAMAGHEDGVVAYGESMDITGEILIKLYDKFFHKEVI